MNLALCNVPGLAAALAAAREGQLIRALAERPGSVADLAERCSLNAGACAHVLAVLDAFGLATLDGDRYGAGPELMEMAEQPRPMEQFELELWRHAPEFLRTGTPLLTMDAGPAERDGIYRDVVAGLGKMFEPAANELAARCGLTPRSILEVGCGSGVWSLALARRLPETRVTGLDLPSVLDQFRARAASLGLDGRINAIEGDMHAVTLPQARWDLVMIANVLRLEPAAAARSLIRRSVAALQPGGSLLIVDALAMGTPAAEQGRAIYSLHLALRTRSSRVHSPADISQWMVEAGCEAPLDIEFSDPSRTAPLGALIARRIEKG